MMGATNRILLIEADAVSPGISGARRTPGKTYRLWARRRDRRGSVGVVDRTVAQSHDVVFRIQALRGIRPTTDWRVQDLSDGEREYRIESVNFVHRNNEAFANEIDLICQFRGRRAA